MRDTLAGPRLAALLLAVAASTACVPTSQFQKAQKATADNQRKVEERDVTIEQLRTRIKELGADIDAQKAANDRLAQDTALAGVRNRTLSNRLDVLQNDLTALAAKMGDVPEYRSLMSHLSQMQDELVTSNDQLLDSRRSLEDKKNQLVEASRALAESENQLERSNAELADKSRMVESQRQTLEDKDRQLQSQQAELEDRDRQLQGQQQELERQAAMLRELESQLKAKDEAMAQLKNTIASALIDFKSDELTVEHKDGKVYVSLEEKLLFASGQYEVNNKGVSAVRRIAAVLKDVTADVDITVEGHTDNVPLRGQVIEDNWDLSAKRATSVLRILVAGGVSPSRVQAVGRADTAPVADNATEDGRRKNRRTEIVLTPKIDQLLKAL